MSKLVKRTLSEALTALELPLASAAVTRHIRVFDHAALAAYVTLDGELVDARAPAGEDRLDIGGYVVISRDKASWDAVVETLEELESAQPEYFRRLMRKCVELSNGAREEDGFHNLLDDDDQANFDLASERDARLEQKGFVAAADARAFLDAARHTPVGAPAPQQPALANVTANFGVVRAQMETHAESETELAFLANVIMSGCSIRERAFTPEESRNAALSVCNLGYENWPASRDDRSLKAAFQVGFAVLHQQVGLRTAKALLDAITGLEISDRQIQFDLAVLRHKLRRSLADGRPFSANNALEVVMILDTPGWNTLVGFLDHCPVVEGAFISSNAQLAAVHRFLSRLPAVLGG